MPFSKRKYLTDSWIAGYYRSAMNFHHIANISYLSLLYIHPPVSFFLLNVFTYCCSASESVPLPAECYVTARLQLAEVLN